MKYQVTATQYARLVDAQHHWPSRLSWGPEDGELVCASAYLGKRAFAEQTIGEFYGIPGEVSHRLVTTNILTFGKERRARRTLRRFQEFLSDVEVVPYPPGTAETAYTSSQRPEKQEVYR